MPTVIFNVSSTRINNIELDEGKTIADLQEMLYQNGYDVSEADITVIRSSKGDKLVGQVGTYEPVDGDIVEFTTGEIDTPKLYKVIEDLDAKAKAKAQVKKECTCSCDGSCKIKVEKGPAVKPKKPTVPIKDKPKKAPIVDRETDDSTPDIFEMIFWL